MPNLFANIPTALPAEIFEDLVVTDTLRIERILSHGQSSPDTGWYDQTDNEWVIILQGKGVLEFANGDSLTLCAGDYVNIPAHTLHKVQSTSLDEITVWLAVFY